MMQNPRTASSQFKDYSGRGPSVVVQNAFGEKQVLAVTKTVKQARNRVAAVEQDYKALSAAQWCERYGVPLSLYRGDPRRR
jgi:hypothetical protein